MASIIAIESSLKRMSGRVFRLLRKRGIVKGVKDPALRIALAENSNMRVLKKKLLHKDVKIVDVLAFPDTNDFPHPESKVAPLGEVLINVDIARADFSRAVFLLIHGILHLLGYRHDKKHDIIVMEKLEQEILEEVLQSIKHKTTISK